MRDVLSVRETREQLPKLLERFRGGDRRPVFLGSHRKTEAVMLSIDTYTELVHKRRSAVAQADASLRAEGLVVPVTIDAIVERWVHGEITSEEMEREVASLYGIPE